MSRTASYNYPFPLSPTYTPKSPNHYESGSPEFKPQSPDLEPVWRPTSPPTTHRASSALIWAPSCLGSQQKPEPRNPPVACGASRLVGGLATPSPPKNGNMSTAYSNPAPRNTYDRNAYDRHVCIVRNPQPGVSARGAPMMPGMDAFNAPSQQHQHQQLRCQPVQTSQPTAAPAAHQAPKANDFAPVSEPTPAAEQGTVSRKESSMVGHSLQMPTCISAHGGSLDEFAAQMTCFFWFEDMEIIHAAEKIHSLPDSNPLPRLSKHTEPAQSYKKWVHSILATTQVTQNVILLALLFVYRLKQTNPKVNGNPGSEYRLLTVALMLGNKFLDDNTYTNKTWAEVSGISVKEIHVMEVEFLSNMRYSLLTSKDQWQDWLRKLACYNVYCERAKLEERQRQAVPVPVSMSSPLHNKFSPPLPSPTTILPSSAHGTPNSTLAAFSPNTTLPVANQNWPSTYHPTPSISPHGARPVHVLGRKRSLEAVDLVEPAPKRAPPQPQGPMMPAHRPTSQHDAIRLPVPHLTLDTAQQQAMHITPGPQSHHTLLPSQQAHQQPQAPQLQTQLHAQAPPAFQSQQPVSLPPLGSGGRAMASVYPTTTAPWQPQAAPMPTCGPQTPTYAAPSNFSTPSKRHSPGTVFGSSPLMEPYANHTPISNSPLAYLQQRNSPYKPVRRVNTLLYPPPTMPLSQYHLGPGQMHYHPVGRLNDLRLGVIPEFAPARPQYPQAPSYPFCN